MDKRIAHPGEEETVRRAVAWNRRWGQEYAGLFYQEELAGPDGMDVQIFVTESTTDDEIQLAEHEARETQDVVGFGVLVVPAEWLEPEIGKASAILPTLMAIVEEHTSGEIRWEDGTTQAVDVTTANMLLQVLGAVNEDTKAKTLRLMEKNRGEFLRVLDLAWGCVE